MKRTAAILALALCTAGGGAHAQIQGPMRERLISVFESGCKAKAASQQVLSPQMASALCDCEANYAIDRVTGDQLVTSYADLQRGVRPAWVMPLAMEAAGYCLTSLSKPSSATQPSRKHAPPAASQDAGVATYVVPVEKGPAAATAPAAPVRPEECSSYVLKVVTDPSQSVCSRK